MAVLGILGYCSDYQGHCFVDRGDTPLEIVVVTYRANVIYSRGSVGF